MSITSKFKVLAFAAVLAGLTVPAVLPATATAQNQGGGAAGGGGRGQGGGGGGGNNWQQQRMDQLKADLGTSDEEFAAIEPKIKAVQDMQMANMRAMMGGGGRGGRGGRGGADATPSPVATAKEDLATTLKNKDAKPEEIKAKLDAYRAAKTKAKDEMTKAQDDLKGVLTARQEAVMVQYNVLE